jgi:hypothetical protein
MEEIKLTYDDMRTEANRESVIDIILASFIGAGLMTIVFLLMQIF